MGFPIGDHHGPPPMANPQWGSSMESPPWGIPHGGSPIGDPPWGIPMGNLHGESPMRDPQWKDPPMGDSHGGTNAGNPHNPRAQAVIRIASPGLHLGEFSSTVCHAKLKRYQCVYVDTYIYIYIYGGRQREMERNIYREKETDCCSCRRLV